MELYHIFAAQLPLILLKPNGKKKQNKKPPKTTQIFWWQEHNPATINTFEQDRNFSVILPKIRRSNSWYSLPERN